MKIDEMERLTALQHKLEKERDRAAQLELDNFHLRDERTDLVREIAQLKAKIEYLEKSNTQKG